MWVQHVAGGGVLQDLLPLLHQGQECAQAIPEGRRVPGGRGANTLFAAHVQRQYMLARWLATAFAGDCDQGHKAER